jgi:hypothetical protein
MALLRRFIPVLMLIPVALACSGAKKAPGSTTNRTAEEFCESFGRSACNETVVSKCSGGGTDTDKCIASQAAFCMSKLESPAFYNSKNAKVCLNAVAEAYKDAKLSAAEVQVVRELAAPPCDQLIKGPGSLGSTCTRTQDCNTLEDLSCVIRPGDSTGSCQVPEIVGGGFSCTAPEKVCADGFYCNGQNCIEQPNQAGADCASDIPCGSGFNCIDTSPDAGTGQPCGAEASSCVCQAKISTGGACTLASECKSGVCAGKICQELVELTAEAAFCADLR